MSQYDPTALTLDYAERAAETRRSVASSAWAAANGLQVGSIAPGQSDEVYLQIVEELPEAALDQAGRLLYQRRADANDLLYVGIIDNQGDPRWVLLSELQEGSDEEAIFRWVADTTLTQQFGVGHTGTEVLVVETSGSVERVNRRNPATGASLGTFGSKGTGNGQFQNPQGVAVSPVGNIHVVDQLGHRVVQFNSSRTFVRNMGSFGTGNGNVAGPIGVACDSSSNVYVADTGNKRVAVFNSTGTWQRNIGSSATLNSPYGVAVSSAGELFVSDNATGTIVVFNASTGAYLRTLGSVGSAAGQFSQPRHIALDANDDLFVADYGNKRIQQISAAGTFLMQFQFATAGGWPTGVAISGANAFVGGFSESSLKHTLAAYVIAPNGAIEVAANGTVNSSRARLNFIGGSGVAVTVADDATNLEADITLDAFPMRVVFHNSVAQWLNMQSVETPMLGLRGDDWATPVDLSRVTEARVIVRSNSAVSGSNIRIRYTTTGTGASMSFAALANSGNVSANLATTTATTNTTIGSWTAIAAGAKINPCYIAPYGQGGNDAADPYILYVAVEFR